MKILSLLILTSFMTIFCSCENLNDRIAKEAALEKANKRPATEESFLARVKSAMDLQYSNNAIEKDKSIADFNKYAIDSLKEVKNWLMVVNEINDDPSSASSFAKALININNSSVYNLKAIEPIKIDNSIDTIAADNKVEFTYTIIKHPKTADFKRQLDVIKTLKPGDTILVSGGITHLDREMKINFGDLYDDTSDTVPWNVDIVLSDIKKRSK